MNDKKRELEEQLQDLTKQLRIAKGRYRATLDSIMEGCQIIGFDWSYLYVNDAVARHGRTTKEKLLGSTMMEAYPGIEKTEMFRKLKLCMDDRIPQKMENEFTFPDGSRGWFELSVQPVPEGIFVLSQEITERKHALGELQRANRALKTLSTCNKAIIKAKEEQALLNDVCQIIVEQGGYQFVWIGFAEQNEHRTVHPAAHAGFEDGYLNATSISWSDVGSEQEPSGEAILTGEVKITANLNENMNAAAWCKEARKRGYSSIISLPLRAEKRIFGSLSIYANEPHPFDKEEVKLLNELASDLSYGINALRSRKEELKLRKEKEKMQAQFLQAQKMEAIGILAGGIAHDFNNLLTAISGNAELLLYQLDKDSQMRTEVSSIVDMVESASALVKRLLIFSSRQKMKPKVINLNKIIGSLAKMIHRLIGKNIKLLTVLDKDLWQLMADQAQLEQVIMNIVVNARDAISGQGTISMKTENITIKEEDMDMHPRAYAGDFVLLSISDNGKGMEKKVLDSIFEPFFTTKGKGKGTGLGLSTVYGIVKQHKGWITVDSERGKGSRFMIYLPSFAGKIEEEATKRESESELDGNGERILIIEDEDAVANYLEKAFQTHGYAVLLARNAKEAVEIFEREQQNIDLIFSDIILPDRSGIQLVDTLNSLNASIPVILNSGHPLSEALLSVIKKRGFTFLQKPYTLNKLLVEVKKALKGKQ